jgi:predicted nucleic acid-binding protein
VPLYLADTSIWAWANKGSRPDIAEKLAARFERGEVAACAPVVLEVMHRAKDGAEYDAAYADLFAPLDWLPLTDDVAQRAVQVRRELAQTTHEAHLRPAIDFLVAAIAEAAGGEVILWAFDKDLRVIAEQTGQAYEGESSPGRVR